MFFITLTHYCNKKILKNLIKPKNSNTIEQLYISSLYIPIYLVIHNVCPFLRYTNDILYHHPNGNFIYYQFCFDISGMNNSKLVKLIVLIFSEIFCCCFFIKY